MAILNALIGIIDPWQLRNEIHTRHRIHGPAATNAYLLQNVDVRALLITPSHEPLQLLSSLIDFDPGSLHRL